MPAPHFPCCSSPCYRPARGTKRRLTKATSKVNSSISASSQSGKLTATVGRTRTDRCRRHASLFSLESVDETAALVSRRSSNSPRPALNSPTSETGKRVPEVDVDRAQLAEAVANARKAALQLTRDEAQFRAGGIAESATRRFARQRRRHRRAGSGADQSGRSGAPAGPLAADRRAGARRSRPREAVVAQAQWKLDQKRVGAPLRRPRLRHALSRGEWVAAGSPVVQMLPPQNVKVRFFVPETIVGQLGARSRRDRCTATAARLTCPRRSPTCRTRPNTRRPSSTATKAAPSSCSWSRRIRRSPMRPKLHPGQPVSVTLQ